MTDNIKRISHLVLRKLNESISQSENVELEHWLTSAEENRIWFDRLTQKKLALSRMIITQAEDQRKSQPDWDKFVQKYLPEITSRPAKVISIGRRIAVAASILVLVLSGALYWYVNSRSASTIHPVASRSDVPAPKGNNTILMLGDRSSIVLDSISVGNVATQGKTNINKASNGQLIYTSLNGKPTEEVLMNTLSTSYGGSSRVTLPDGSMVWLNSLSSLRFPNAFVGKNREVDLTGQAYFEIAPNKKMPFRVRVNGTEVAVLGTHFDVMAYANEGEQRVTLLEGSVKVSTGKQTSTLAPGQQAQVKDAIKVVSDADPDQVIAWVAGKFKFQSEGIEAIMRQLERWYNIEVSFEGKPTIRLSGSVSKSKNLSAVLELLRLSGVNCEVEGRKVIVKP